MSRSKAKRRSTGSSAGGGRRRRLLRLSPTALKRTWSLVGWALAIVAIVWGLQRLERYVRGSQHETRCRLEWIAVPPWMGTLAFADGERVLDTIAARAELSRADTIRDRDLCEKVGRKLGESPWVIQVDRVTAQPDGTLQVQALFRQPLAFIEVNGWAYLVDENGTLLPPECSADFIPRDRWFVITGVKEPIPKKRGETWPGHDLAAGLKLAKYLRSASLEQKLPFRSSIRAIDVGNYNLLENAFDGPLRLRTIHPRCYIRWGEPPGGEYPIEVGADRKLDMLRSLYAELGRFPDGQILDVRKEDGIELRRFPGS